MSVVKKKEIVCPNCGKRYKLDLIVGINNAENPEFKDKILKENFFKYTCKNCNYECHMLYPLLYTDIQRNYCIAFTPLAGMSSEIKANKQMEMMLKRRVKSSSELKEKILIFDNQLNDMAVEITKSALCSNISRANSGKKVKAYFSRINEDENMEFAVLIIGEKKYNYHCTRIDIYNKALEMVKALKLQTENEFLRVGPTYAKELLSMYKKL